MRGVEGGGSLFWDPKSCERFGRAKFHFPSLKCTGRVGVLRLIMVNNQDTAAAPERRRNEAANDKFRQFTLASLGGNVKPRALALCILITLASIGMGFTSLAGAISESGETLERLCWAQSTFKIPTGSSTTTTSVYIGARAFVTIHTPPIDMPNSPSSNNNADAVAFSSCAGLACTTCDDISTLIIIFCTGAVLSACAALYCQVQRLRDDSNKYKRASISYCCTSFVSGVAAFANFKKCYNALGFNEGDDDQSVTALYQSTRGFAVGGKLCVTCFVLQVLLCLLQAAIPIDEGEGGTEGRRANFVQNTSTVPMRSPRVAPPPRYPSQFEPSSAEMAVAVAVEAYSSQFAGNAGRSPPIAEVAYPSSESAGSTMARVLYDYPGQGPHEQRLTQGEVVKVLQRGGPGAFSQGVSGKFPTDYVEFVENAMFTANRAQDLGSPPGYDKYDLD